MQLFKNADLPINNQEVSPSKLCIDVAKPYEQKQIDTRWIQLKLGGKLLSRAYFASCIQAGKVFIHGGYNEEKGILDDFVEAQFYDLPSKWVQIKVRSAKNKNPPSLRNHTLCAYTSNLVLFGGQKNMLQNNSQFYKFDLRSNQWQVIKVISKQKLTLSLDSHIAKIHNNFMYIFGGYDAQNGVYSNKLFQVNLANLQNNQITVSEVEVKSSVKPAPRGNFSGCIVDNQLYIFGGTNSDIVFDDMWVYNFETKEWKQIEKKSVQDMEWPQKRKGHIMVCHAKSRAIFMFGGIKQITKEQNDIMVFLTSKSKWVRIHRSTNQLYEPSPTIKKQVEYSPSIIQAKLRKTQKSNEPLKKHSPFKIGMKSVTVYSKAMTQSHQSRSNNNIKGLKTQYGGGFSKVSQHDMSKKHMSVVQQKKLRQFLNRKKKLLSQVNKASIPNNQKRAHSPTSQTIIYSLGTIGQQKKYSDNFHEELPKVIFDQEKGALIGKKPCARDGHGGLVYEDSIIIIGGDRHMMSFADVYLFKMDKAVSLIHLYQ